MTYRCPATEHGQVLRAASYNNDCQSAKVEDFLMEQGLHNLNFEDRVQRNYTVTMLEGCRCKQALQGNSQPRLNQHEPGLRTVRRAGLQAPWSAPRIAV